MKTIKIVGIVALAIALVVIIIWAIKESVEPTDVVTGAKESEIKKAAEAIGLSKPVAEAIAKAPDSGAAARRIGIPPVIATAIANGIDASGSIQGRTITMPSSGKCPDGWVRGADGTYCKAMTSKDLSSMA